MKLDTQELKLAIRKRIASADERVARLRRRIRRLGARQGELHEALTRLEAVESIARELQVVPPPAETSPAVRSAPEAPDRQSLALEVGDKVRWLDDDFPALLPGGGSGVIRRGMTGAVLKVGRDLASVEFETGLRGYLDLETRWERIEKPLSAAVQPERAAIAPQPEPRQVRQASAGLAKHGSARGYRSFGLVAGLLSLSVGLALALNGAWREGAFLDSILGLQVALNDLVPGLFAMTVGVVLLHLLGAGPSPRQTQFNL